MDNQEVCWMCGATENLNSIFDKDGDATDEHVCDSCVDDRYDRCRFCDEDKIYYSDELNSDGECFIHRGESEISPEDQAGWEDNITKWNEE